MSSVLGSRRGICSPLGKKSRGCRCGGFGWLCEKGDSLERVAMSARIHAPRKLRFSDT